jgi:pyrroline-5-carboxylate reductase
VTSPGGTTAAAIAVLDAEDVQRSVRTAIESARDRSRELSKG